MQGISICGSVASLHGANCRRACVARNHVRLPCEVNAVSQGLYSLHWCVHKPQTRTNGRRMSAVVRTNARWLFGGDGRSNDARLERSESANEDILIFYFQMDLQTRIQVSCCLFIFLVLSLIQNQGGVFPLWSDFICLFIVTFYNLAQTEATAPAAILLFH